MRLRFRTKLMSIVGTAALAFLVIVVASVLLSRRSQEQLTQVRELFLPKVELGPRLEAGFDALRRGLQDAVAAKDLDALEQTRKLEAALVRGLAAASAAVEPGQAAALQAAIADFYLIAHDVSRRLIAEETGEELVDAMAAMQAQQARTAALVEQVSAFDRGALTAAFERASRAQVLAGHLRVLISVGCMALVLLLSLAISRGMVRSLGELTAGLERFGRREFAAPIRVTGDDELADVARHANRMADNLEHLAAGQARTDWLKSGSGGLTQELRGELTMEEVAGRALGFLSIYLDAPACAMYLAEPGGGFRLLAGHGGAATTAPVTRFAAGEGLVGRAALAAEPTIVEDLPADYLRIRSGLGEAAPRVLVLVPVIHLGRATSVVELALLRPWREVDGELVRAIRETLAIALEVARSRTATRELLVETQHMAERLATQEEELRARNEDMTAQQEELRQTNDELTQQTNELDVQRRELEARNHELTDIRRRLERQAVELTSISTYKSQFLTNMSHELRTPLNSMLLLSELLGENPTGNLTAKQVEFARTIHGAGKDLLALINEVLDLAKIESGRQEVRVSKVPLDAIARQARRVFEPQAHDRGLDLTIEIEPGAPEAIATDAQRVDQIVRNLLGNAVKFTERGSVALRIGPAAPDARLTRPGLSPARALALAVTDTGPGIPPDAQQRIFAPFEQLDAAADRRYGGTGLGLAIARELSALLGGELQLDSHLGQGSTFTCYLPLDRPLAQTAAEERAVDAAAAPAADAALLIIEDDPTFAARIAEVAHSQGLDTMVAPDGPAGIELARARQPVGIILDVGLPGMDGFRVMEALRADPATAAIPVHFLSAADAAERGLALGAIGYLTKPASGRDLARVVGSFAAAQSGVRLLVVEDDLVAGESLERRLGDEGYTVRRVTSATAARAAIGEERFACMILDLSLPDMDGLELLVGLQESGDPDRTPPVVVYTARALTRAETHRLEAYTEAIVLKEGPSTDRLLGEIRLFLRRVNEADRPRSVAAARLGPGDVRLEGKRLLVVDDDMRTVFALSATLRAKGAEVLAADSGEEALSHLRAHPDVDAILMDIMMPGMDGYEAMRRIRQEARFAALPIIALTAKAMKGDEARCREAGATDYLPKPIDADRLFGVLHERLAPGAGDGR